MRMNQNERRFDFHGLGLAIKQAREERDWTQAYLAAFIEGSAKWQAGQLWPHSCYFYVPAFRPERKNLLVGEPPQTRLRANMARRVSVALLLIFTPPNVPAPSPCPAPHLPMDFMKRQIMRIGENGHKNIKSRRMIVWL